MTDQMPLHDDYDSNTSGNPEFRELLDKQITRRSLIKKTAGGAVALTLATSLTACGSDDDKTPATSKLKFDDSKTPKSLQFQAVNKNIENILTVPEGYEARVLYAMGDPIFEGMPEWSDSEIPSGASFTMRSGDCHDGMTYFGMTNSSYDEQQSNNGLLVLNHEYVDDADNLHPVGHTYGLGVDNIQTTTGLIPRTEDEALREINCHGVSIIEVSKDDQHLVTINKRSLFNRRITAASAIDFTGPVKGNNLIKTRISPDGSFSLGTINNCGNGYTPWGTYLTTEENFNQYFSRDDKDRSPNELKALDRYKIPTFSKYKWHTVAANLFPQAMYERWMCKISSTSAEDDFRNTTNTFGWIVEIDPFDSRQRPVKRTALGRFAHEDCRVSRAIPGQPLAFYMGDDSQGEYIYKFVSDAKWDPKDINGGYAAGDKYMNSGKLFVAKFDFDENTQKATGEWIELNITKPLIANYSDYKFADQADVLVNARLAADAVGATKMDRPEWVAVNPQNGEVYVTLTNNSSRGSTHPLDSANPRNYADADKGGNAKGNINGHIIRFKEAGDVVTASTFTWDIFLFGAEEDSVPEVNLSNLGTDNDFSSPDGMWFDPRGVLWIQTDDGAYTDETNCMMLAALPGQVGDGQVKTTGSLQTPTGTELDNTKLRRFLTGPSGCEITGVTMTPDYKTIFVNVQHPGGVWPSNHPAEFNLSKGIGTRPRSATVVITRKDGGEIVGEALEQAENTPAA